MTSTASTTYKDKIEGKLLVAIATGTTTGVTVKIKQRNGATPTWPTTAHRIMVTQVTALVEKTEKIEVAAGTTQSGTTVTLGTLTRALSLEDGTNFTGSVGTAQSFAAGADVRIVIDSNIPAMAAMKDLANTFTDNQTLDTTKELRFNSSATAVWKDGSGNLSFKDAANGTKTLTTLAAAAGADEKAKVSSNDTTQGYLNGKLVAGAGITLTENNDGSNETLSVIAANTVATGHTGLSSVTSGGLLVGAGASNMTVIGPGSSGQVPVSNGTTIAMTSGYTDWLNVMKNTTLDSYHLSASETYALQASYTVPATMAAGTTFRFRYHGTYNMNATGSFIKFNLGSTTVNIQDSANDAADNAYFIEGYWTCVSTGGSGSFIYYVSSRFRGTTTTTASTTATTIDTTATNLFKITVVGGGGGADPWIKNSFAILDRLN